MDRANVPASAITYRDLLVAHAVAGLAARLYPTRASDPLPPGFLAESAVELADAVLAELDATDPPEPAGPDPFAGGAVRVLEDDGEPS